MHPTHWLVSTQAHGTSNPFISKINGVPCGWGQCALDAALRLIAEADRNADGLLTRSELAAYDGPVPASCGVGRDWSASAKARGGDWDERAQRKTGLARLCYQVLCDRDRSIALGQAYRTGYRKARPEADCARRSVAVVLSGGFTSPARKYGDDGAGSRRGSASDLMSDASRRRRTETPSTRETASFAQASRTSPRRPADHVPCRRALDREKRHHPKRS